MKKILLIGGAIAAVLGFLAFLFMMGVLAIGGAGIAIYMQSQHGATLFPSSAPSQVQPEKLSPSGEILAAVAPIQQIGSQDRHAASILSQLYADMGEIFQRDDRVIVSTVAVKNWASEAEYLLGAKTKDAGKLPGFKDAQFKAIVWAVGDDEAIIKPDAKERLIKTLYAISWALAHP